MVMIIPNIIPKKAPPKESLQNFPKISKPSNSFPLTSSSVTENMTYAVPSLKRLSPSIIVERVLEAPRSFRSETTATGSVAEINAPNIIAASKEKFSSYPRINLTTRAVRKEATRSHGPARIKI